MIIGHIIGIDPFPLMDVFIYHVPFDGFHGHVCCFKRYLRGFEGTEERVKVGDVLKVRKKQRPVLEEKLNDTMIDHQTIILSYLIY